MRLTDQAQRALAAASEAAHASGAGQVGRWHLLLGLAEAGGGARHALGDVALDAGPRRTDGARASVLAAEVKTAIEAAVRRARGHVTSVDLLAVLLEADDGPVAAGLRAAGHEPAALRAGLGDHSACCPETVASFAGPVLAEIVARAGAVPRRGWLANLAVVVPLWLLVYAVLLALTWDTAGPELVLAVALGAIVIALLSAPLLGRAKLRQYTARSRAVVPLPDGAGPLLERLGLRALEVHLQRGIGGDRCLWLGRRALIMVSEDNDADEQRTRFVLWHEVAHLARRDSLVWTVSGLLGLGALTGAVLSFDPRAMLFACAAVLAMLVAGRWGGEMACDRLAVRQAGAGALRAWAIHLRAILASARRNGATVRRAGLRGRLTHPPLALRMVLHQH